jgi:hypothetical protein
MTKAARAILERHLIPEQIQDLEETNSFNVRGADHKIYRVFPRRRFRTILSPTYYGPHEVACAWFHNIWADDDHIEVGSRSWGRHAVNAVTLQLLIRTQAPVFPFCSSITTQRVPPRDYDKKLRRA